MKCLEHPSPKLVGLLALLVVTSCFTTGHEAFRHDDDNDDDGDDEVSSSFLDLDSHNDELKINDRLLDLILDENRSRVEQASQDEFDKASAEKKNLFEKMCPAGYFKCLNGECISPKWLCDGHYDCDDFSDELNCTTIDLPSAMEMDFGHKPANKTTAKQLPPPGVRAEETSIIKFNSSTEPLMLFSTGTSIRGYWMRSRIYFDVFGMNVNKAAKIEAASITQALSVFFGDFMNPDHSSSSSSSSSKAEEEPPKAKNTIVGLDMDPITKEVFWVELGQDAGVYSTAINAEQFETRLRRQYAGPHRRAHVDSGLISPEDVALDTLGRNIYITDAGLPAIVVCSIKYSHCKMLIKDRIHKPRAIIADSATGWLTYTDWGDHPGIFLVSMDGKKRETLIDTDIVWPNGLAADYQSNQLYWADARLSKIERIDLVTMKRRKVIVEAASNPFSLSLFENRLYWSDWAGNDIRTCEKLTGNNTKKIMKVDNIYGIHIYHPSLHQTSDDENPCWSKHCSHMCLLSPSTVFARRNTRSVNAVCACPEAMALSIGDRATCYESQLSFLLINVHNYIAQVFPEQIGVKTVEKVIYSRDHVIHDVASDWLNFRLFFFDATKEHIYSVDLTSTKSKRITKFLEDKKSVRGLQYDPWSDNLYWIDTTAGSMSMCPVKTKTELVMRKNLDRPVALVMDSKNRVFYLASLGHAPSIMRTDIFAHESSDQLILGSDDVGLPIALHLDEQQQRLYWADARHETIESLELDLKTKSGYKIHSRIHHRGRLGTILAFTVFKDNFLWMTKNSEYLYKASIEDHSKDSKQVSLRLPPNPSSSPPSDSKRILVVDPRREIIVTPCRKSVCAQGCILNANHTAICVSPDLFREEPHIEAEPIHHSVDNARIPLEPLFNDTHDHEAIHTVDSVHTEAPHPSLAPPPSTEAAHTIALPSMAPHIDFSSTEASHLGAAIRLENPHNEALSNEAEREKVAKLEDDQVLEDAESSLTWLILLLLVLVIAGLVTLASILFFFKPRNVSHLLVGFRSHYDKEGAVVLLDD